MKLLGLFVTACLVIAAAQAVATAAVALSVLAFLVGLVVAPKETFGLVALAVIVTLSTAHPLAFMGLVAILALGAIIRR